MIAADATPLLHLAWAGLLDLLPRLYGRIVAPESVWDEIVGTGEPRSEAHVLQVAAESWLEVRKFGARERRTSEALRRGAPIGRGEADAIAVAEGLNVGLVIDDRVAVDLARMRGVETRWTTTVVLEAWRRGILDGLGARRALEALVGSGLWVRQDVLLRLLSLVEEG